METYKTLIKEIKDYSQMDKYIRFIFGKINVIKMTILSIQSKDLIEFLSKSKGIFHRTKKILKCV